MPRRIRPKFRGRYIHDCTRGIFTVNGRAAGLDKGSAPNAPVWNTTPSPVFTEGVASSYSLDVSNASSISWVSPTQPSWLTISGFNLVADGTQDANDDLTSVVLRANGTSTTDSNSFNVTVNTTAQVTTFRIASATTASNQPFAFGHVFGENDIPVGQVATASLTDWQCTPITYWPNGKLRHAIIAGRINTTASTQNIALNAGSISEGTHLTETNLAAAMPTVTITAGAFNWNLTSSINTVDKFKTVCTGHVMSNWIYRMPVSGSNHLVLWADVRFYIGGSIEIFPWVENAYFLVANPTSDTRNYSITIGATTRFPSTSIAVKHHTRIPLINSSNTAFSYWTNAAGADTNPQITPKHDTGYLRSTKMVPNVSLVTATSANLNTLPQTYSPNTLAGMSTSMGVAGTSAAVITKPDGCYLASSADSRAWSSVLTFALSGGSWSSHYRDNTTNEPLLFTSYPLACLSSQNTPLIPEGTGGENGIFGFTPTSHQPAFGYMAWLLSARWWFLDEMLFWATNNYLYQSYVVRQGSSGIIQPQHGANTDRGAAWGLRTLAQSLVSMPSTHPCFASFKTSWEANMNWYVTGNTDTTNGGGYGVNTLGVNSFYGTFATSPYQGSTNGGANNGGGSNWQTVFYGAGLMHNMIAINFGFTWDLNLPQSTTSNSQHQTIRDFTYNIPVAISGDGLGTNWSYRNFGVFALNWGTVGGGYYSSWSSAYADYKTGFSITLDGGTSLFQHGSTNPIVDGVSTIDYFSEALEALAYAVDHGKTGALAGWNRVTSASNYSAILASTNTSSSMQEFIHRAVGPRLLDLPTWRQGQALNEWREISGTAPSTIGVYNYPTSNNSNFVDPWCGFAIDTRTNEVYSLANGGHADYYGNEVVSIVLNSGSPTWGTRLARSALQYVPRQVESGGYSNITGYYLDGKPTSAHTYYSQQFIEARNRAIRFGVGSCSDVGNPTGDVNGFNPSTNTWDVSSTYSNMPGSSSAVTGRPVCKHPTTEDVYYFLSNAAVYKWTQATNTWAQVNANAPLNESMEAAVAYDSTLNRILILRGSNGTESKGGGYCATYDTTTNLFTARVLIGAAATTVMANKSGIGMVYIPALAAYLVKLGNTAGSETYKIDASTFETTVFSTTGGASIPITHDVSGDSDNVYTRFLYAPSLGGVVYFPKYSANAWFLRVH
jgi:hypothetical protein